MNCVVCGKFTSNPKFCSRSCAAKFNNVAFPKRLKEGKCKICGNMITANRSYCGKECYNKSRDEYFTRRLAQFGCYYHQASDHVGSKPVRNYLIRKFGNACMICGQDGSNWHSKPITLIVDHINGHADDWSERNIRLVCPNCDCQLPTFKGRNKGNSRRKYTITQKIR